MSIDLDDIESRIKDGIDDLDGPGYSGIADEAFSALAEIIAEVERLRGEVSYLRACVPPVHPSDYGHEVWTAALREAEERGRLAALEEAAVLLDELACTPVKLRASLGYAAHRLRERGEHRREGEK